MKVKYLVNAVFIFLGCAAAVVAAPPNQAKAAPDSPTVAAKFEGASSGFEGREEALGRAMSTVLKTMQATEPYPHELNDALVKALLNQMQFAKDRGLMSELIDHDRKVLLPLLQRTKKHIDRTGNNELALVAMFERTTCHSQLVDETIIEPGKRIYNSPYKTVLDATRRLEQFDMTERWIHDNWTVPRFLGMADVMGVNLAVSPWREDGLITVEVLDSQLANN